MDWNVYSETSCIYAGRICHSQPNGAVGASEKAFVPIPVEIMLHSYRAELRAFDALLEKVVFALHSAGVDGGRMLFSIDCTLAAPHNSSHEDMEEFRNTFQAIRDYADSDMVFQAQFHSLLMRFLKGKLESDTDGNHDDGSFFTLGQCKSDRADQSVCECTRCDLDSVLAAPRNCQSYVQNDKKRDMRSFMNGLRDKGGKRINLFSYTIWPCFDMGTSLDMDLSVSNVKKICKDLQKSRALAFAMGLHSRLGSISSTRCLDDSLLRMILVDYVLLREYKVSNADIREPIESLL